MDSSYLQYPNLHFSSESYSSYVFQEKFPPNSSFSYLHNQALSFNENDSQEMLLMGVLNQAREENSFDTTSANSSRDNHEVNSIVVVEEETTKEVSYRGCSRCWKRNINEKWNKEKKEKCCCKGRKKMRNSGFDLYI
ncbi:hypothetical protein HRI_002694100 [Hibiscus trionum]|uniref:Uncharacterized protein n=1 Tax=Hibiscus trionum TaxID=183268 RepID=A0A9W7I969_HIBTR|nr:hypothetical protein HRI_002694100 [Hibiscus trionum]